MKLIYKRALKLSIIALVLGSVPLLATLYQRYYAPSFPNPLARVMGASSEFDTQETLTFTSEYDLEDPDYATLISEFVKTPDNGTPWDVFIETREHPYSFTDEEGMNWDGLRPEFTDRLLALDNQIITIQGYMFPLGQSEDQDFFLFGPFPLSCPYHYHSPPKLIIEVFAPTPIPFDYDAINITGRLELVPKDDEYNVFYRLHDATMAP